MFHSVDGGWSEGNKFYFVLLENKEDIQRHTVTWFGNDKRLETKEDGLKIGYASHDGNKKFYEKIMRSLLYEMGLELQLY